MKLSRHWLWLLFLLPGCWGLGRLRLDTDVLGLLPADEPVVQGLNLYQQHFGNARELIVTLRAPDPAQADEVAGALGTRLRQATNLIASAIWQPPWMEAPTQAAELLAFLWFNQPPAVFSQLTNRLAAGRREAVLREAKALLATSLSPFDIGRRAYDPYDLTSLPGSDETLGLSLQQGARAFGSADGTTRLLFVRAARQLGGYRSCKAWLEEVQAIVAQARAARSDWDSVVVHYTGRPAFVAEIASSMQRDMSSSVLGTAGIICLLFWLAHRRWLPLVWLLTLLVLILVSTLALGALGMGRVNVVSLGFAAILLGLAVDYAVVHYQEALAHPHATVAEVRRAIAPSILWAAVTTISAFLVLNLGGLPGLAQLGSLVAIGITLSALVMVMVFLPPLFRDRPKSRLRSPVPGAGRALENAKAPSEHGRSAAAAPESRLALRITFCVLVLASAVLAFKRPPLDGSADALRPRHSKAEEALEEVKSCLGVPQDPMWMIVAGETEEEVHRRLREAEAFLQRSVSSGIVAGYSLPLMLCPRPEYQRENRATARGLAACGEALRADALAEGFSAEALALTEAFLPVWQRAAAEAGVVWPTNQMSRWIMDRCFARGASNWLALGLVYSSTNQVAQEDPRPRWVQPGESMWLSGWDLLGSVLLERVRGQLLVVLGALVTVVLTCLGLAFRNIREVLLSLAAMVLSLLVLLACMALTGRSWNLLNLMALPLVLGTGVDYGIFIQLALRRHDGDLFTVRRSVGRALLLCGGTAVAGFGSLVWCGYSGMASLGVVCAIGIGANMLIAVYLLPTWWVRTRPPPC